MKRIAFLTADPGSMTDEERAALRTLRRRYGRSITVVPLHRIPFALAHPDAPDLCWWHYEASTSLPDAATSPEVVSALRAYLNGGGSLLLSLLAAQYVLPLGIEQTPPNVVEKATWNRTCWAEGYPDIRGFSTFLGHPLFDGLGRAAFTWAPAPDSAYCAALYAAPAFPLNGRVIAIERQYIKLNDMWRLICEYRQGPGRVLTVGSFVFFNTPSDRFRPHLERFLQNCVSYLTGDNSRTRATHWKFAPQTVSARELPSRAKVPSPTPWKEYSTGLSLKRPLATAYPFDVGGRRILIMGVERRGIEEIWTHPFRAAKNLQIEVFHDNPAPPEIEARPEAFLRLHRSGTAEVRELTYASPDRSAGVVTLSSSAAVEVVLGGAVDLRLMWPYAHTATGPIEYRWDNGLRAFVITSPESNLSSVIGISNSPIEYHASAITEGNPAVRFSIRVRCDERTSPIHFVVAGSDRSEKEAITVYLRTMRDPAMLLKGQVNHFQRLWRDSASVECPIHGITEAYQWALAAHDRFMVTTPGLGTSLMAGYATTSHGWDGGQEVNGRPGYAWYFGRDSLWCCLSMLAAGQFDDVRTVLSFLGGHQDLTGKILHELTSSGHLHYDAADSTPLYILVMGRYLRASGDRDFLARQWPRLLNAVEFCFSTDTDGDGLIENTNVGHGWAEGGPLFPSHVELYLASCWVAALREAAYTARRLRKHERARAWATAERRASKALERRFWDASTGWFRFGINADGTVRDDRTVSTAAGAAVGALPKDRLSKSLAAYAKDAFTADWGVRILETSHPRYVPEGYHNGSVWPLFTGWAALAEAHNGRPLQALMHVQTNLELHKHFSLGYVPEVLHGDRFKLSGVCAHQAWSEAMVFGPLHALLTGIEASGDSLQLRPLLRYGFRSWSVRGLRAGRARLSVRCNSTRNRTEIVIRSSGMTAIRVSLSPVFPVGTRLISATVNGRTAKGDVSCLALRLRGTTRVVYLHAGGISITPPHPQLQFDAPSQGPRLIEELWKDNVYEVIAEGRPGKTYDIEIDDMEEVTEKTEIP